MALEDPRWAKFLGYIRKGNSKEDAARLARLPGVLLRNAVARAKAGDEEYMELFEEVKRAEAECVNKYMERLDRAAETDMRAIRFGLEAFRPERFRPDSATNKPQQLAAHVVTDDAAKQHLIELAIRLMAEDPKAREALAAALSGKDPPQLPEAIVEDIEDE